MGAGVYLGVRFLKMPEIELVELEVEETTTKLPFTYPSFDSEEEFTEEVLNTIPEHLVERVRKILPAVIFISQKHEVNPLWVLSVMWNESHFNPRAKSYVGAHGLMQIMPETKVYIKGHFKRKKISYAHTNEQLKRHYSSYYPALGEKYEELLENIEYGIFYLRLLHDRFGNLQYAIVAYNMGPGWLRYRLKNNLPVGVKNRYLNKVRKTFLYFQEKLNGLTAQNDIKNFRS